MRLLIVSHTSHYINNGDLLAYGPYIREMNLWLEGVSEAEVMAPLSKNKPDAIHIAYTKGKVVLNKIPAISLTNPLAVLRALVLSPIIYLKLLSAMRKADHIHLRCPGNIGLLGCLAQIWFPSKMKTAKYAGNWDPRSRQPLSYRFQKWLLSNTVLTKNMKVLVYGQWKGQSSNVKPFFTATYSSSKKDEVFKRDFFKPVKFLFVGSLAPGKRPLYAVKLVEKLRMRGLDCRLDLYGEGAERNALESYIEQNELSEFISLRGNVAATTLEIVYKESHILILASKSEGWPKVVAEAMFWGMIPAATPVSCVGWMLDKGDRGLLLQGELERDIALLESVLQDVKALRTMSEKSRRWSQQFTLESFKKAIHELL